MSQSKEGSHRRKASIDSQKLLLAEFHEDRSDPLRNATRLEDVRNGLTTSKELLRVLNRISGLEERNSTCVSLFSALKAELDRACIQVNKLLRHQTSNVSVVDLLLKEFAEEKRAWKVTERDRVRGAIITIAGELELEKKLRRQAERLNKRLGRELADTKKELESEKRAREILEQACDELAEGIGEDRAEVEELKRESSKAREEVEKEREMLQLADVLREERVQMKLLEAKYEFEEKNAILDKLKSELEFKLGEERSYGCANFEGIKELERYLTETLPNTRQYQEKEKLNGLVVNRDEPGKEDDSVDSDLCSIELNMDDNNNKGYEWDDAVQNGSKRKSIDKKHSRIRFTSEKIQRQSVSLERVTSDGIEGKFSPGRNENLSVLDRSRLLEFSSLSWRKDYDNEIDRYNMIKDLRDHIVSGSSQEFASPIKQWGQQTLHSDDPK